MTAERDLLLALVRRLHSGGLLMDRDIAELAEAIDGQSDVHDSLAHDTRLVLVEAALAKAPGERPEVERRRKEMRARTAMIEKGEG